MNPEESDQVVQRRANLEALKQLGVDPYPHRFDGATPISRLVAEHSAKPAEELDAAQIVTRTAGRILAIRTFGKAGFLQLSDGRSRVQVYVRQDSVPQLDFSVFRLLDLGDWVGVEGRLFRTKTNEFSVHVSTLQFLAKSLLPLPEKWHGLQDVETRYRQRYLDLIVNPDSRRVFEVRSRVVSSIREFLTARGFLEVETPMMQAMAGGALARPFVTHHNALDMPLYMRVAPELYLKRLVVGGIDKVFEINRNFRNEGISTQHNPEFTMLEFYWAYADYHDLMSLTEEMLSAGGAHRRPGRRTVVWRAHDLAQAAIPSPVAPRGGTRGGRPSARSGRPRVDLRIARGGRALAARLGIDVMPASGAGTDHRIHLRGAVRRAISCSLFSCTTFQPRSRRCRSNARTTPTPSSGSSSISVASKSRTPSAS